MPQSAQQSSLPDLAGQAMSLVAAPINSVEQASREGLEQAFSLFNQMSTQ